MDINSWIEKSHFRVMVMIAFALAMLFWVTTWSMAYAASALAVHANGMESAAVIAAVQVPASFFAKWACEIYERIAK